MKELSNIMSKIYKITNDINNKVYIGKTNLSIEKRFKEHCDDSKKDRCENRPLYRAMNKYGIEHFCIEEIEECLPEEASDREIYWIGYYHSYGEGYNATIGGDGKNFYDHSAIANRLKKLPYPIDVANEFGCSTDTVYIIAKEFGIKVMNKGNLKAVSKQIAQYSKSNEFIQYFESSAAAGRWVYEQGKCATLNSGVRSHITDCANGKRKTAYGYIWKYE